LHIRNAVVSQFVDHATTLIDTAFAKADKRAEKARTAKLTIYSTQYRSYGGPPYDAVKHIVAANPGVTVWAYIPAPHAHAAFRLWFPGVRGADVGSLADLLVMDSLYEPFAKMPQFRQRIVEFLMARMTEHLVFGVPPLAANGKCQYDFYPRGVPSGGHAPPPLSHTVQLWEHLIAEAGLKPEHFARPIPQDVNGNDGQENSVGRCAADLVSRGIAPL
jgi:hypothetical protein